MDSQPTDNNQSTQEKSEVSCPNCGEHVRVGVVRCWNCQAFMRADIEQKYQEMISQDRPVIYSDAREDVEEDAKAASRSRDRSTDQEADFDLGDDVALYAEDGDFELASDDNASPKSTNPAPEILEPLASNEPDEEKQTTPPETKPEEPSDDSYAVAEPAESEDKASDDSRPTPTESKGESTGEDHSIATGGEALWEIAQTEQMRKTQQKRTQKSVKVRPGSVLVYCPNGHRIEVQERHRGRVGRCPKCKSAFTVPVTKSEKKSGDNESTEAQAMSAPESHFADLHLHHVDPGKLKLKQGSLAKTFETIDICLSEEGMLLISLSKKGGLFGGASKPEELRKELFEYLSLDKGLKKAPGENNHFFSLDDLKQLAVVHPTAYAHESILGGVDVFGPGLIGVRVPKREDNKLEFLALTLSQFRKLREQLQKQCGIELEFEVDQIPLQDKTTPSLCHYTDEPIKSLNHIVFYENDSEQEIELVGWKCQACGLTVSEDGRKKENIGGKTGKGIAKAKCPKCENAFGKNPLYALKQEPLPAAEDEAAEE